jgi:DNA-binding NarL/FixJ family response regulator
MKAKSDSALTEKDQPGQAAPGKTKPLRIVMVNDEPLVLDSLDMMIRFLLKDAAIPCFGNCTDAMQELSRTEPDLLITDDMMPGLEGREMVRLLLLREATYPIVVFSTWSETDKWVLDYASQGYNIAVLPLPCTVDDVRRHIEASLKITIQS